MGLRRLAGDAAEEVAQEAFVVALERWDYVSSLDAPDAWLWVVARRLALRRSGRERARVLKESLAAVDSWHGEVPVDVDLADAVNRLPGQQRAAVVLHYLCGLPVSEVAGIVGGSDSAAKVWLHRARGRLGVLVGGYEGRWVGERRWSTDDVATLARQLGVQGHLDTIRDDVPGRGVRRVLTFDGVGYLLATEDGERLDHGRCNAQGYGVTLDPAPVPGTIRLRARVDGTAVSFRRLEHTTPLWHGISDQVFMAMLLEADVFNWVGAAQSDTRPARISRLRS